MSTIDKQRIAAEAFCLQVCTPLFHVIERLALSHEQGHLLSSSPNGPAILRWLN